MLRPAFYQYQKQDSTDLWQHKYRAVTVVSASVYTFSDSERASFLTARLLMP